MILTGVALAIAALCIALAVPLVRGRVPPNAVYGFRTPKTLASEEVWYEANRAAGRHLLVAAAVTALTSAVIPVVPEKERIWVFVAVVCAPLLVATAASLLALRRM